MRNLLFLIFISLFSTNSFSSEAVGFYSNGSIKRSASIYQYNGHFEKLFKNRKRSYGTDHLLDYIFEFTNEFSQLVPDIEKFQIGDISAINGGHVSRHGSHQNGLDVDIVYLRVNKKGQDLSNPEWDEYFTWKNTVSKNFDTQKNWNLFKYLVSRGGVGRIFVDAAIKSKFCALYGNNPSRLERETLRRLRPAKYHSTHFHLRLKCVSSHRQCKQQADPANSTGCMNIQAEQL